MRRLSITWAKGSTKGDRIKFKMLADLIRKFLQQQKIIKILYLLQQITLIIFETCRINSIFNAVSSQSLQQINLISINVTALFQQRLTQQITLFSFVIVQLFILTLLQIQHHFYMKMNDVQIYLSQTWMIITILHFNLIVEPFFYFNSNQSKLMSNKAKIDPETGLLQRSVNIQDILEAKNIPSWGKPRGTNVFERVYPAVDYVQRQRSQEMWLYNRRLLTGPSTEVLAMDDNNNILYGINFASADYLGLAQNELAKEAAIQAAQTFGVNSAGSPLAFGATKYYMQLKEQLADFWGVKSLLIYSAGWLAGFGVIKALVKQYDHIIMDQLSHNCLQQGANAATKNIIKFPHLNHNAMVEALQKTRESDPENAILVVTEGLFSMDSDTPDLVETQKICKKYGAYLLIDCAHDFGCMGDEGKGCWQIQKLTDLSNVLLIGTGSKCLSTNIGFVGCNDPKVIEYLKYYSSAYMFTNAINPVQAATSLANLRILRSEHGKQLRKKVMENYNYLRQKLESRGHKIFGNPCPILPLYVGNQIVCRLVSRIMMDTGVHVNGIEYPVVKIGQARLRVNLMPQHTRDHLDKFVQIFQASLEKANKIFEREMKVYMEKQQKIQSNL